MTLKVTWTFAPTAEGLSPEYPRDIVRVKEEGASCLLLLSAVLAPGSWLGTARIQSEEVGLNVLCTSWGILQALQT